MAVTTEPAWLNKSSGIAARNGTTSHTIPFGWTAGIGTFLVVVVAGAVTHAATGWTERLQPVSSGELSVFTKAGAGESSIVVTHNGGNYPVAWTAYEFPAGTTYTAGTGSSPTSDAFPALTGLPGSAQVVIAARSVVLADSGASGSASWAGTWVEDSDLTTPLASGTDGIFMTTAHQLNVTATSITPSATTELIGGAAPDRQHVVFALNAAVVSGGSETKTTTGTALADAIATGTQASVRTKAETALADTIATASTTTFRTHARTASAIASATRVTAGRRPTARTASVIVAATASSSKSPAIIGTASAVASATRVTTSQRASARIASAITAASAVTSRPAAGFTTGLAVAKAGASAVTTAVRIKTASAIARSTASATNSSARVSSRTASGKAIATGVSAGQRTVARTATARASASSTLATIRASARTALARIFASGVSEQGDPFKDIDFDVLSGPVGSAVVVMDAGIMDNGVTIIAGPTGNPATVKELT